MNSDLHHSLPADGPVAPEFPDSEAPQSQSNWLPIWMVLLLAVLLYRSCLFMDDHGGGFSPLVFTPYVSTNELENFHPKSAGDAFFFKGKAMFSLTCAPCHQLHGLGVPGQFPPLAGSDWVLAPGPNRMIRVVLDGLAGPILINGQEFNSPVVMVPWRSNDMMTDEVIAAILTYVRQNKEWGNNASPVKPEQVAAIRQATEGRAEPWSAADLLKVPVSD